MRVTGVPFGWIRGRNKLKVNDDTNSGILVEVETAGEGNNTQPLISLQLFNCDNLACAAAITVHVNTITWVFPRYVKLPYWI